MSFLFVFFLVSITLLDVLFGVYAAIQLGYGPPSVREAFRVLWNRKDQEELTALLRNRSALFQHFPGMLLERLKRRMPDPEEVEAAAEPEEARTALEEVLAQVAGADISDLLTDDSEDLMQVAPIHELFDDDLVSILMDQGTEAWLMAEKHVESSILKLNVVMMKSGRFAADLDNRLRALRGTADMPGLRLYLQELKDDCTNYLENQAIVSGQIRNRVSEFGELKYLAEDIEYANMEQASQIETTLSNLDQLVLRGTAEEGVERMLKELSNLRLARHRLRDMQDRAFLTITRYEQRIDSISQQLFVDETNGLRNRIGLDVAIFEWWRQKRHEKRKITFALLDFVGFGELNDKHGITVCDNLIRTVGHILEKTFDPLDLVGLHQGNCFLVATVNMGPRKTMSEIDRIRQQMEKTTFTYDNGRNDLSFRFTCAVTEAPTTKTDLEVIGVLEATLAAAKKAGHNQTFIYDPNVLDPKPEKLEAPGFGFEPATVAIEEEGS
ncbi:MAG TPA: hypothetical protein DEB39_10785 [Planctomycetaceae bacterium]|nr:hypothetical protein [Planctomycetaceae bacterium]